MCAGAFPGDFFRDLENCEENDGESDSGNGCNFFGEEIDDAQRHQSESDEGETNGNLSFPYLNIQRHTKFPLAGLFISKHQHREAFHGEAPHHAKSVSLA